MQSATFQSISDVVDDSPVGVVVTDETSRVLVWNGAAEMVFGLPPVAAIGRRLLDLDLGDDAGAVAQTFASTLQDGIARTIDFGVREQEVDRCSARLAVSRFNGGAGIGRGAIGVALDLTTTLDSERQLAELTAEVSAQAGILHAILDHVPADLHLLDADGRFIFVSPGSAAGFAFEPSRLLGRPIGDMPAPPGLRVELERLRRRVARFGSGERGEVEVTVGAVRRSLELDLRPVRGSAGAAGTLVSIRDVSMQRAQEAALQRAYLLQSQLIANTPLGVIEWDREYRIRRWSAQAEVLFGWRAAEVLGRRLDELRLVHPEDLRRTSLANAALMDSDLRHNVVDQRNLTQGREERFCRWYNSIVRTGERDDLTVLSLVEDLTEQEEARRRIRDLAERDPLTGLLNRTLFRDRLGHALARARRLGTGGALLLVDLDNFKDINDTYGHASGDAVLVDVAARMTGAVRESDTVARLGGDEFALIVSDLETAEAAGEVTGKLLDHLTEPLAVEDEEVVVGASIGVALFPEDADDADDLFNKADVALYRAKGWGRRRCVFYRPGMNRRVELRRQLAKELRQAVDAGALELFYQPQVSLADGRLVAAEALLRWRHPEQGLLTPAHFLEVAERSGCIRQIGPMVVERGCEEARRWYELRPDLQLRIGLNMSRTEWLHVDLLEQLTRQVDTLGLPAPLIEIDVAEPVFAAIGEPGGPVDALAKRGITITLEGFGRGSAPLHHLAAPSVRAVKLAPELLQDALSDPPRRSILDASVRVAHELGKRVVATGVARAAERDLIEEAGCDAAQGIFFGRPMPADELAALVAAEG